MAKTVKKLDSVAFGTFYYENSYRRGQGLGERNDSNQITMTQGDQTLVMIDFTTHKERVVVDNNTQQIKSVQVIKKQ